MNLWVAISLLLIVLSLYMLVTDIFSVAFRLTGLSEERVRFQVASLFTNAGFTTNESEVITNNKTRRRLAIACMYSGHLFTAIVIGLFINLMISLANQITSDANYILFGISLGVFLFFLFLKIPPVNRHFQQSLGRIATKILEHNRKETVLTVLDYFDQKAVVEIVLNNVPVLFQDKALKDLKLTKSEINILMVKRKNHVLDVTADTMLEKGDTLVAFGIYQNIKDIFTHTKMTEAEARPVLDLPNTLTLIDNYGDNAMVEIQLYHLPTWLENTTVKTCGLKDRYQINIVMIRRDGESLSVTADTAFKAKDTIVLFGRYRLIKQLFIAG